MDPLTVAAHVKDLVNHAFGGGVVETLDFPFEALPLCLVGFSGNAGVVVSVDETEVPGDLGKL